MTCAVLALFQTILNSYQSCALLVIVIYLKLYKEKGTLNIEVFQVSICYWDQATCAELFVSGKLQTMHKAIK